MILQLPNITLNQKFVNDSSSYFKEISPSLSESPEFPLVLTIDYDGTLSWAPFPKSEKIVGDAQAATFFARKPRPGFEILNLS